VAAPENWLIKVGVPVLSTPKYTGSLPQSAGSDVPLPMATPHFVGLAGPVTITGSWSVNIACGADKFEDGASWYPNPIPSWAAVSEFFPTPVTVQLVPLQLGVTFRAATTGVSLLSAFKMTSGNVKLLTGWLLLVQGP
jgi:hypothetical protein